MPDINHVSVTFGNGTKREEYGPVKRAEVTIAATVAEGEDDGAVLDMITQRAMAKVAFMLDAPRPTLATAPEEAAAPPKRRGRPPKDEFDRQVQAAAEPEKAVTEPASETPITETSGVADEWEAPANPEVTDKELLEHTSDRAKALGDREKIKNLISSFNPDPTKVFKVQDIGQDQRRDYLDRLAALT